VKIEGRLKSVMSSIRVPQIVQIKKKEKSSIQQEHRAHIDYTPMFQKLVVPNKTTTSPPLKALTPQPYTEMASRNSALHREKEMSWTNPEARKNKTNRKAALNY
jgi:hypothetical protein